MNQAIFSNTQQ
uniref:Uncharacterized protein n=1 Tax=Rhizophora mucronata TaxID=61149 RepID=A0A2P2R3P9_RHIMU